jgi:hypothetical protein
MSRHHNTKHFGRGRSQYPKRLESRGLSKAPSMTPVEQLRNRQIRRVEATCTMGDKHNGHKCNGQPWPDGREGGAVVKSNKQGAELLEAIFTEVEQDEQHRN